MKFYQAGRGRSRAREQGLGGKIWRIEFSRQDIHLDPTNATIAAEESVGE